MSSAKQPKPKNANAKQITKLNKKIRNLRSKVRKQRSIRRRNRITSRIRRSFAPVSLSTTVKTYARITQGRNPGTARLAYCELFPVYKRQLGFTSCFIQINPAKWTGTRTHTQAMLYSQFRPLSLTATYVPNVATNTPGQFSFGAIYGDNFPSFTEALPMQLPQFEGGFITTIWQRSFSRIRCGTMLLQNNFNLSNVDPEDIPITLLGVVHESDLPDETLVGYVALSGVFDLKGVRTQPLLQSVSGVLKGTATISDDSNSIILQVPVTQLNKGALSPGTAFQAIVTGQEMNPNTRAFDWGEFFTTFRTYFLRTVEVVGQIARVVLTIVEVISALPLKRALTNVELHVIGRSPVYAVTNATEGNNPVEPTPSIPGDISENPEYDYSYITITIPQYAFSRMLSIGTPTVTKNESPTDSAYHYAWEVLMTATSSDDNLKILMDVVLNGKYSGIQFSIIYTGHAHEIVPNLQSFSDLQFEEGHNQSQDVASWMLKASEDLIAKIHMSKIWFVVGEYVLPSDADPAQLTPEDSTIPEENDNDDHQN